MKTTIRLITPEWAKEVLANHNPRNRPMSQSTILTYAIDMENGRWTLNHQGIAFDDEGNLFDGQQRLNAIVLSGCPIEMMVTTGVPHEEKRNGVVIRPIDNVDRMRPRTIGQTLQLGHGYANGNVMAAGANGIIAVVYPDKAQRKMSTASVLFVLGIYGKELGTVVSLLSNNRLRLKNFIGPAAMAFAVDAVKTERFLGEYQTLENMSSPVRTLRKWMEQHYHRTMHSGVTKVVCSCIQAYFENRELLKTYASEGGREWLIKESGTRPNRIRKALGGMMPRDFELLNPITPAKP